MKRRENGSTADRQALIEESQALSQQFNHRAVALKQASRRIGSTPKERLGWVVAFAAEDADLWHPGEVSARGDCLLALVGWLLPDNFVGGLELPEQVSAGTVACTQAALRTFLLQLVSVDVLTPVPIPVQGVLDLSIGRATAAKARPARWYSLARTSSLETGVLVAVRDLVLSTKPKEGNLIACELCGAPVFATHKRRHCPGDRCLQKKSNLRKAERLEARRRSVTPKLTPKRSDTAGRSGRGRMPTRGITL